MTADNWSTGVAANLPGRQSMQRTAACGCALPFLCEARSPSRSLLSRNFVNGRVPWMGEAEEDDRQRRPRLHQLVQGPGRELVTA